MLCRINPIIHPHINTHMDLQVHTIIYIKIYLTRKLRFDLKITHKLFELVAFVLYRILPSTAGYFPHQQPALGETQTIGFTNRFNNPDVAVVSLA